MVNVAINDVGQGTPLPSSSFNGTPSLTINHDATVDLDSTNAFEGPEKLLEVWFGPSPQDIGSAEPNGLKAVPVSVWEGMLDLVNCKVLSILESEDVDAYLLSESSMFIFPHKLILKTCGTTTLLWGLPRILEIAAQHAGFPKSTAPPSNGISIAAAPYRVFYSRKNFLFPDRQRGPHRSWNDEVKAMDNLFLGGSAYMIGKMNGEHWYLYLTEPFTTLTPPSSPGGGTETKVLEFPEESARVGRKRDDDDETLEVLMTDLDEENAKQFYLEHASAVARGRHLGLQQEKNGTGDVFSNNSSDMSDIDSEGEDALPPELTTEGHALGTVVTDASGIADIYPTKHYPDSRIDAYLFTPCGLSANGVVPAPDGVSETHYFTVHVTPEPQCSYASFETNVPQFQKGRETADIVNHVVGIFKPGRFSVTLFEAKPTAETFVDGPVDVHTGTDVSVDKAIKAQIKQRDIMRRNARMDNIPGYRRVDRIVHDLDGYDLVFRYYERNDWKGGAPRIGEHIF